MGVTVYLVDEPAVGVAKLYASQDPTARLFFLQDAVYAALGGEVKGMVYVLREDLVRRGLEARVPAGVRVVGYPDLVSLMEEEKVVNLL